MKAWLVQGEVVLESKKNPEGWSASDKLKVVLERTGLNATDLSACFWQLLHMEKINCSMAAKGCRWCNVEVESSFSTLKLELNLGDVREVLISPQNLQSDLPFCIEGYHIRVGRHSSTALMNESDYLLAGVHRHSKAHQYKLFIGDHEIEVTPRLGCSDAWLRSIKPYGEMSSQWKSFNFPARG